MEKDRSISRLARRVPSPSYIIDKGLLRKNLRTIAGVKKRTGCRILLALKAFSAWSVFDICREYLDGTSGTGLYECRLGSEQFGGETHLCAPAIKHDEIEPLARIIDHAVFNSLRQFNKYARKLKSLNDKIEIGLRINPRHSEVEVPIYDPCASGSRLGIVPARMPAELDGIITGLHFHTLCEKNSDSLERTLIAVCEKFGEYLPRLKWVNFGGGHHITRPDYDIDLLCRLITGFKEKFGPEVYLEPGEAVALNAGFLVAEVLDIVHNDIDIAMLDTSASAHMPDVLEMPYRPKVENADKPNAKKHTYRLAGRTCLAGDVIGDYSFEEPLKEGDRLVFHDMAHYTMVKNTMFNGIQLPDIVLYEPEDDTFSVQRRFTYDDFKSRLS